MTKKKDSAEKAIRDIRRATRRQYSAQEKIRIVLEGLRDESSVAELCHKKGINQNLYYRWSKEFLEAGKKIVREWMYASSEIGPKSNSNPMGAGVVSELFSLMAGNQR